VKKLALVLIGVVVLGLVSPARAAFTVTLFESGSNVDATGSGTLDLSALTDKGPTVGSGIPSAIIDPVALWVGAGPVVGPGGQEVYEGTISGPSNYGPGNTNLSDPNSLPPTATIGTGTGDPVTLSVGFNVIYVPAGYLSFNPLSDTATFSNESLASMGVIPGTYTWTWGTGRVSDSFTLIAVPEPASLGLLGVGGMSLLARRRHP
jgi:hypothetical protein